MSTIQLGWQVYLSNVAAPRDEVSSPSGTSTSAEITDVNTVDDSRLLASFRMIDLDGNGFLDTAELQTALAMRGHKVGTLEVKKMMLEANKKYGRKEDGDRRVSFEAFRRIVKKVRGKKHF
jgi:Ca2+-binding EF-hand superfamily protein